MVPTQELNWNSPKSTAGNILHYTSMWECMDNHIAFIPPRSTPIGPVAGHYKNPILPFGLVLNFLLFFRQHLLKQLYISKLEWQKDLQKTSSHALLFNADVSPFGFPQCIYKIKTWSYIYSFQQFFVSSVFPHFFSLSTLSFCVFLAPHHPRLGSLYLLLGNCPPTPSLNQP